MVAGRLLLIVAGAVPFLGCYHYVPTQLEAVPPGSAVRVLVSTEGQVAMLNGVGIDARSIAGTLEATDSEAVRFAVRAPFAIERPGAAVEYVRFALPPKDILRLELKQFDGLKTTALVGAILGTAATVVIMAARGKTEGGSQQGQPGLPPVR